ncbi:DUF2760 domain-containing protein [bacterium]|nr:DUF2760 domain-containing protein [bacterium]
MAIGLAFQTFFKLLFDRAYADRVRTLALPTPPVDPHAETRRQQGDQLRLLSILQRDGRLLDFFSEDLSEYSDAQIGQAVRDIHRDCKAALAKYVTLEPILAENEESSIIVPAGVDPARIRLIGQVKGQPPHRGTVAHRGWRASGIHLPVQAEPADPLIVAPAEVEIA